MFLVHQASTFEDGMREGRPRLVLALALTATSLLWTGRTGISASPSASNVQTALPTAYVGDSYHGLLPVSGSPHALVLSSGQLPPGLALNAVTGGISGTPMQVGYFRFAVMGQS